MTTIRVALVIALATGTAAAQNERYPPEPVDKDKESEDRSDFWERALEPARGGYDRALVQARRLIDARTPQDRKAAIDLLDAAIEKLPGAPDAYFLRGWAHENAEDWAACADDYVAAHARDADYVPAANPRKLGGLLHAMGVCLARANRLEEAETVLTQLTSSGRSDPNAADTWTRLGEVYMAQGRLDDAITALTRAIDSMPNGDLIKTIRWLRAVAYDRARLPAAAAEDATEAAKTDVHMARALDPALPYVPAEERYYIAAIAADASVTDGQGNVTRDAMPERALVNFREFIRRAPDSRWRKRAEEHVAALRDLDPTRALERRSGRTGSAAIAKDKARAVLRKELPALERCMKDTPTLVLEVTVTMVGAPAKPAKPATRRRKPRVTDDIILWSPSPFDRTTILPQPGVTTRIIEGGGHPATAPAQKCVESVALGIKLRLERGTYTRWTFPVYLR